MKENLAFKWLAKGAFDKNYPMSKIEWNFCSIVNNQSIGGEEQSK